MAKQGRQVWLKGQTLETILSALHFITEYSRGEHPLGHFKEDCAEARADLCGALTTEEEA